MNQFTSAQISTIFKNPFSHVNRTLPLPCGEKKPTNSQSFFLSPELTLGSVVLPITGVTLTIGRTTERRVLEKHAKETQNACSRPSVSKIISILETLPEREGDKFKGHIEAERDCERIREKPQQPRMKGNLSDPALFKDQPIDNGNVASRSRR